jgi:hypothetical protein
VNDQWGWRQTLTWRVGFRRAESGRPYSCPWWADEQVYGLAYLQGKGVQIPSDPLGYDPRRPNGRTPIDRHGGSALP